MHSNSPQQPLVTFYPHIQPYPPRSLVLCMNSPLPVWCTNLAAHFSMGNLRSPWRAPVHFRVMSHTRRTGTMRMCAHGRCQGKGARESLFDWALHAIGSGRGSGCVLLCNGLLRLCVSVDRDRSRVRPLPAYVSRALKTVDFRVSPAPRGLAVSGLRDPRWAGRAARSVRWRQGAR